ncbi:hypothetical protein D9M71_254190 [compost metagenome]
MFDTDHGSGFHTVDGVEKALHFTGADLHAPRLDHMVHAAAKIQITVLVETAVVPGIQHAFPRIAPRLELERSGYRVAPIAGHDRGATNHQLSDLMRLIDTLVLLIHQPQLGVGNGNADTARFAVDVFRWQVGAALALGQAIHRENQRLGKQRLHLGDMRRLERGTGVGNHAHIGKHRLALARVLMQQRQHGRHERDHGDLVLANLLDQENRPGEFLFQHQGRPGTDGHDHLVQTVIERQRQRAEHLVGVVVPQVGVQ